jgi:hypothetical protein
MFARFSQISNDKSGYGKGFRLTFHQLVTERNTNNSKLATITNVPSVLRKLYDSGLLIDLPTHTDLVEQVLGR